ncbi:hypothetical protein GH714_035364 [Hevea brasiliensis]|uniref:Pentatricopeptide repeat-containing protein n=1 Tax=Hevea brasiliensis TaxID=3981 RepID=A0A6A6N4X1_HEVBR|nr:hypothetical protein GH714_035364 [Hevea brasiliensis]
MKSYRVVYDHLLIRGIYSNYTRWIFHRECVDFNISDDVHDEESVDGDTTPFINDEEDNRVHEILEDLRGVIGNSSKFVNEGKVNGLKSHHYHALLQRLLLVGLYGLLSNEVSTALMELRHFFQCLCCNTLKLQLKHMEEEFAFDASYRTLILSKTLSTSSAVPSNYQRPPPSSYQDERNPNGHWNHGNSNQWGSPQGQSNPNQWPSQGGRNHIQWNEQTQTQQQLPQHMNSAIVSSNTKILNRIVAIGIPCIICSTRTAAKAKSVESPSSKLPQYQNPGQTRNYPQYQNRREVHPNAQGYRQPRSPNQLNNQNQGYPQAGNPEQWAPQVHDFCLQSSYRGDLKLNNKVIEMYGKCASMTDARRVFDHMPDRNMDSWHLMINGYANNNLGDEGLLLFEQMRKLGLKPTEETFLAVLSACASADAVEEGFLHLESMKNEYGINPRMEHYLGVIDVLGKSGFVNEIEEYIEKLPFESTVEIWGALRNYARIHGDVDLEDLAEELMVALDSSKAVANKIPTPLPKKYSAISMLEGKNRIAEFRNPTFTKMMRN